jgi:small subunit ribosomal protein S9
MITTKKTTPAKKPAARRPRTTKATPKAAKAEPAAVEAVAAVEAAPVKPAVKPAHGKSFYAVGRRKTAVAQILMSSGNGTVTVNKLALENYFQTPQLQYIVRQPLAAIGMEKDMNIQAKVHGGGIHAQAESVRHAVARAVIQLDPETRRTVKKQGFLMRDPRVKERKKPGLKRARRAPQFSKR